MNQRLRPHCQIEASRSRSAGFTLVELLVVIAIIGILIALLLPAVQTAREAARRTACANNLKQIGLALHTYASANSDVFPPGGVTEGPCCGTPSGTSWSISILPFVEQQGLYDRYNFNATNEHSSNAFVRESYVDLYICPSEAETRKREIPESGPGSNILYQRGSYRGVSGRSDATGCGWFDSHEWIGQCGLDKAHWKGMLYTIGIPEMRAPASVGAIKDGLSNTLAVGEMASRTYSSRRTFWAYTYTSYNKSTLVPQPRTFLADYQQCVDIGGGNGSNPCKRGWGSYHPGGLQFLMADGAVRLVQSSIDLELMSQMATIAGEEAATLP